MVISNFSPITKVKIVETNVMMAQGSDPLQAGDIVEIYDIRGAYAVCKMGSKWVYPAVWTEVERC